MIDPRNSVDRILKALKVLEDNDGRPYRALPLIDMTDIPVALADVWPDIIAIPPFETYLTVNYVTITGTGMADVTLPDGTTETWQWSEAPIEISEWKVIDRDEWPSWATGDGRLLTVQERTIDFNNNGVAFIGDAKGTAAIRLNDDGTLIDEPRWYPGDLDTAGPFPIGSEREVVKYGLCVLNFITCRNVNLVEPSFARPMARRLARAGVRLHRIEVTDPGTSTRTVTRNDDGIELPLHQVRGHFARYGPRWGRGLLFGKYEGQYWVPDHVRGSADNGEVRHHYVPSP